MSISRAGSAQPEAPTIRAGTPATVTLGGTGLSTTEPAAMREQWAYFDIADDFRPCADQHAMANFWMAVATFVAGAAQRHAMQDRHVILDNRCRADHEAGGVIEENALADASRRD